jgi:hypothetical protein
MAQQANNGDYTTQPRSARVASVFYGIATAGGTLAYQKMAPTREAAEPHLTRREDAPLLRGVPEVEPLRKPRGTWVAFEQSEREGVERHDVKVHRRWQL